MSEQRPLSDAAVEALVRAHLARQAAGVDARHILAGVRARLTGDAAAAERPPYRRGTLARLRRGGGALALAASLLLAFWGLQLGPRPAGAEQLLVRARQAHAQPVDRRYRIAIEPAPGVRERFPLVEPLAETLWTRGDRFWIDSTRGATRWAWGRDEQRRVWLALAPNVGVRFDADEVPERVAVACDVRGLRLETLLGEVLRDFELRRQGRLIRAVPKPGRAHPSLREAEIEIDPAGHVVRRLVLWRTLLGQDLARVSFTLVDAGTLADARYQLEGHIDAAADVVTRERRLRRLKLLIEHLGPAARKLTEGR